LQPGSSGFEDGSIGVRGVGTAVGTAVGSWGVVANATTEIAMAATASNMLSVGNQGRRRMIAVIILALPQVRSGAVSFWISTMLTAKFLLPIQG
jgi:hypothetical protein